MKKLNASLRQAQRAIHVMTRCTSKSPYHEDESRFQENGSSSPATTEQVVTEVRRDLTWHIDNMARTTR